MERDETVELLKMLELIVEEIENLDDRLNNRYLDPIDVDLVRLQNQLEKLTEKFAQRKG